MSKILTLIPSYSPKNNSVDLVIDELKKVSPRIVVFTASDHVFDGCEVIKYDKSIGINLVFEPRKWIVEHIDDDWDYVLYNEDDIFISESSTQTVMKLMEQMRYPYVAGFNRFERFTGKKYWIDQHPEHGIHTNHVGRQYIDKNDHFWIPANFHSANFIIPKTYVRKLIDEKKFDTRFNEFGHSYCGVLESGATSVYRHLIKMLPLDFESIECEHLDNKYYSIPQTPTTETLREILKS